MKFILFLAIPIFLLINISSGQTPDSLIFINDDEIVGELKTMDRGIAKIETDYSDSDFKIEWEKIKIVNTRSIYLITLTDGSRFVGSIRTEQTGSQRILRTENSEIEVDHNEIVFLQSIDKDFISKLSASVDIGFSLTKANSLRQGQIQSSLGYTESRWSTKLSLNLITTTQDSIEATSRTDGSFTFNYFLPKDWYLLLPVEYLSNDEQSLASRWTFKLGVGKFLVHTNHTYVSFAAGLALNTERFTTDDPGRDSREGYLSGEVNLFDVGDLNFVSRGTFYPSITEKGRRRFDFNCDVKYDFPLDLYIKLGITFNYDNQPVAGASQSDYILQTSFGWEL